MISPKPQRRGGVWAVVAFIMLGFLVLHHERFCFTFQPHSQKQPETLHKDANIDDIHNATLGVSRHVVCSRCVEWLTNAV